MRLAFFTLTAALGVLPAFGQNFEFGVAGGGSFYQSKTITNSRGNADAGFNNGFAVGGQVGHNMYSHLGGEFRYMYLQNDAKLSSGGTTVAFGSSAHVLHYDFLYHFADRSASIRPYVALGAGIKYFKGTGSEVVAQPLGNIALLTKTNETKGLVSVGGGLKFRLTDSVILRLDVHDYLSPFPSKIITPAANSASPGGWVNNIVVSGGVSFAN
jgi:hypothetical protein